MQNLVSSIYQINEFPTDRDEVVMSRLEQHPQMKLVTVKQGYMNG